MENLELRKQVLAREIKALTAEQARRALAMVKEDPLLRGLCPQGGEPVPR
jgi:cell division protein FtsB